MKTKVYLAGAMATYGVTDEYPWRWRDNVKQWFKDNADSFKIISPTDYFRYGHNYHKTEKEVMRFDLRKVKESDIILVDLKNIRDSVGTLDEIFYAYLNNKPIIGFLETEQAYTPAAEIANGLHPWIVEQIDRIEGGSDALEKAMQYIVDYYG